MYYQPNPKHIRDDFYAVEATNWLPVNRIGQIIPFDDTVPTFGKANNGYKYLDPRCPIRSVHRIVALTFIPSDNDVSDLYIRHLNGNKYDNRVENLEWATPGVAIAESRKLGLNVQTSQVLVKDLTTGEIVRYNSLQESARFFKCNGASVFKYLKNSRTYPFRKKYAVIYEGEEWPPLTADDVRYFDNYGNSRPILVEDLRDDKLYIFATISHASLHYKITSATIKKNIDTNEPYQDYLFYFLDTYKQTKSEALDHAEYMDQYVTEKKHIPKKRKACQLKVFDLTTGESKIYDSIWDRAEEMGMKKNSLERAIWRTNGFFKGCRYEYLGKTILNKREKDSK